MAHRATRVRSQRRRHPAPRRGFALIAILWLIMALAVLGLDDSATAREAVATSANRVSVTRAHWRAEGCAEAVRAAVDIALGDSLAPAATTWETLDAVLTGPQGVPAWCSVTAVATGDRLDVNATNADALRATFTASGMPQPRADSVADALIDWRDSDSVPRPSGAEAAWYRLHGRVTPSNHLFQSDAEIRLVRGFEKLDAVTTMIGVEPGRVVLDRAPLPVIAALPGFSPEAVARVAELRWRHEPVGDAARLSAGLSDEGRRTLVAALPTLAQFVTTEPDAWIIRVAATAGTPSIQVVDELRLARAGRRAGVTRERTWP